MPEKEFLDLCIANHITCSMARYARVLRCAVLTSLTAANLSVSPVWSDDLNNVNPLQDTYILQNAGNSNFGGNSSVLFGDVGCSTCAACLLLQYDISSIPQGSTVNSATLGIPENLHQPLRRLRHGTAAAQRQLVAILGNVEQLERTVRHAVRDTNHQCGLQLSLADR